MTTSPLRASSFVRSSTSLSISGSPSASLDISSRVIPRSSAICLNRIPAETYLSPSASASRLAWVDFPVPWSPLTVITSPLPEVLFLDPDKAGPPLFQPSSGPISKVRPRTLEIMMFVAMEEMKYHVETDSVPLGEINGAVKGIRAM